MAAENGVVCLLGAMDRLWFHQIVLLSEPSMFLFFPGNTKTPLVTLESKSKQSSQMSIVADGETLSVAHVIISSHDETSDDHRYSKNETEVKESNDHNEGTRYEERPKRTNTSSRKTRSQSSSPLPAKKQSRHLRYPKSALQKSLSCKNLEELELEEVKGFIDLGFIFTKESMSKHMMSLVPGLQRLSDNEEKDYLKSDGFDEFKDDSKDEERGVMRPYLSEAWTIRRPNSPLLNLTVPRASTAAGMKKHLKCWARTVASAIQQES